ncbi:MAG: DUF192 domain-containing protein [Melioribacteraceae bacterium]
MAKKSNTQKPKSKLTSIIVVVIILAFLLLIFSNIFKSNDRKLKPANNKIVEKNYKFEKNGELTFQNKDGGFISAIDLEFAENNNDRTDGLMYRTEMKENQGMLFIFPTERMQSFWMKNTVLSLDMLFVNSKLEIVTIHKNTKPYDENSYLSSAPAQYVVEVNAGYTTSQNIKEGDKVIFRRTD